MLNGWLILPHNRVENTQFEWNLNAAILYRISPRIEITFQPFSILLQPFYLLFWKNFPWFLRDLYHTSYNLSLQHWTSLSFRQSVLQSVRPSFYQNLQSFSELSPGSGLVILWVPYCDEECVDKLRPMFGTFRYTLFSEYYKTSPEPGDKLQWDASILCGQISESVSELVCVCE